MLEFYVDINMSFDSVMFFSKYFLQIINALLLQIQIITNIIVFLFMLTEFVF